MRQIVTRLARLEKTAPDDDPFSLKKLTDDELEAFCRNLHVSILSREDCAELHAGVEAQLERMDREACKWAEFKKPSRYCRCWREESSFRISGNPPPPSVVKSRGTRSP